MYSFFGQFGNDDLEQFDSLFRLHSNIWMNSNLQIYKNSHMVSGLGQAPNAFFPLHKPVYNEQQNRIYAIQGHLWTDIGFPEDEEKAALVLSQLGGQLIEQGYLSLPDDWGGMFILIAIDNNLKNIWITSDYSGMIPLYFSVTPQRSLLFSTHIRPLSKIIHANADEIGIIQQACLGHTIGRRTIFNNIFSLNPGETLTYNAPTQQISYKQSAGFYSQIERYKSHKDAIDALWADYIKAIKTYSKIEGTKGILLSGGFDSRLVLGGFDLLDNRLTSITFGDPENFEAKIAQKISRMASSTHIVYPVIEDLNLSPDRVTRLISRAESYNFPYCEPAAEIMRDQGAVSISTGYAGETVLGGQGYSLLGAEYSKENRLRIGIKRSIGLKINFAKDISGDPLNSLTDITNNYLEKSILRNKRMFNHDLDNHFELAKSVLREDIKEEYRRILLNSPQTYQQALERFWFEHHVLKHFGRQSITLMTKLPLILPITHHAFLRRCSNLNPDDKIDHGVYLGLLKQYLGEYSRIPTSNIPISLTNPDLLLWISRAIRAKKDQEHLTQLMQKKGDLKGFRYGWSNFEVWIRLSSLLDECPNYISKEIFSFDFLREKIINIKEWKQRVYSGQDFLTMITISQLIK